MLTLPVLDINTFNQNSPSGKFYANRFSNHLSTHHHAITEPHKHNFYLSVLFTSGHGTHEIDFQSYPVKPGSLFVLSPGQTHSWELSDDIEGIIFFHDEPFYDLHYASSKLKNFPFYYSLQNSRCIYLEKKSMKPFHQLYEMVLEEHLDNALLGHHKIKSLIDIIYIELSRLYINENKGEYTKTGSYTVLLNRFEYLINENYKTVKSPSQYASIMNISTRHLNRICKELLNKTSSDIINERVLLEAKRMLLHTKGTVAIVADNLGFNDYSYFSRLFKEKCNETPTEFQKRYR